MRVLVTGAAGFIGSHLCERFLARGDAVVGLDGFIDSYDRSIKERNVGVLLTAPGFRFVEADLRSDPLDDALTGIDVVVNAAAMPGLPRSWTEMDIYTSCNLVAVQRLLDAVHRSSVSKFLQISTSSVYGLHAVGDETIPTRPVSPYGVTKLAAEHLVLAHMHNFGLPVVILRYFSVYGPRQRPDMAYHIFIEALLRRQPIRVFGDARQSRSNTYVSDCVEGTIRAVDGAEPGETYNLGGAEQLCLAEAISLIGAEMGVRPVLTHLPARPGDQRHTMADTSKAQAAFEYRPTVTPVEGLSRQVAWHDNAAAMTALATG